MGKGVASAGLSLGRDLPSRCLQGFHDGVAVLGMLCWEQGDSLNTRMSTPLSWSSLHESRGRPLPSPDAVTSPMHCGGVRPPSAQACRDRLVQSECSFTARCSGAAR